MPIGTWIVFLTVHSTHCCPSLDTMQFGSRKGRSTTHYLADLVQFVLSEVELGRYVNLLMIDYSKAFDKVDITVALEKLLSMNLRPALLNWVGSFLSERQQCVKIRTTLSAWTPTSCGVPQGTKVGPVVFLAMVNQVASSAPKRWKYVDNITAGESYVVSSTRPSTPQDIIDICADATRDNKSLNVEEMFHHAVPYQQVYSSHSKDPTKWSACPICNQYPAVGHNTSKLVEVGCPH